MENRIVERVIIDNEGCWMWQGSKFRLGYAQITFDKRVQSAHRISYKMFIGGIPDGLELDHLCSKRACVNPGHLEPVTHAENARRASERQLSCKHGHPYTIENTYFNKQGGRSCKACNMISRKKRYTPTPRVLKTHCPKGHEYTEENTYRWGYGRSCRACRRL